MFNISVTDRNSRSNPRKEDKTEKDGQTREESIVLTSSADIVRISTLF